MSLDGQRVFFDTRESLNAGDIDASVDVYERFGGATTLISNGVTGGNGAFTAFLFPNGLSDDGTRAFFDTRESLMSSDTDTSFDIYAADVAGYPRPLSASPAAGVARSRLREVHRAQPHARASAGLSVVQPSGGGVRPGHHGHVGREQRQPELRRVRPLQGAGRDVPGPPEDSDVRITASLKDVRCRPTGREMRRPRTPPGRPTTPASCASTVNVRMTDRWNATAPGGGPDSATVQDVSLGGVFPCAQTASTATGSTCTLTTSVNAIIPGPREGRQAGGLGDGTGTGLRRRAGR